MTDTRGIFLYGSLCHLPLLELVLGHPADSVAAALPDHAAHWVRNEPFPMIRQAPGQMAQGLLLPAPSCEDRARMDFYEGGFDFALRHVRVRDADGHEREAEVYFPDDGKWEPGAPWSLADWADRWGALSVEAATEAMAHYGIDPPERVAQLLPVFRARAWARQIAAHPAPQTLRTGMTVADVETLGERGGFDGFFRVRDFELRHRLFEGEWSAPMRRESFHAFDAALVLPYDPATDCVMLIEQLRFGPLQRGDPAPWVLEPIAGLVDAGEDPEETARREAVEEARLHLRELRPMSRAYASPGYSTEFFHFFLGLADLSGHGGGVNGLDTEHENIRNHVIPFDHAMALLDSGEINAAPLAMMLLWLSRKRESLRRSA